MSYTIGFTGKGGTGKTTIASIVIRYLAKKSPVLAIDADPNSNLGDMLGLTAEDTVVSIIDDIAANIENLPAGVTKERLVESRVQQSLGEGEGIDLLAMGRPEGPGCYCYPNSLMRGVIGKLEKSYKFIVIDNEAGMEHISRRTDRKIDYLFLVSDPNAYGMRSAKRILNLAKELKVSIGKSHLIVNKVRKDLPITENAVGDIGADKVSFVNESMDLLEFSLKGRPMKELDEGAEIVKMIYKICEEAKWQ
ncbi:MAG: AAA family ATPase [Candidatus Omnitrophica bacterium]|nr:AAA family ATPase [Candidatus Omnitrophota bacterium]